MAKRRSNIVLWVVLGIFGGGFVMVSAAVAGVVVLVATYQSPYGTRIQLNHESELYYTKEVSKTEADKLAAFLNDKYVTSGKPATVQLTKPNGVYQVRFVIDQSKLQEAELPFLATGYLMSTQVFDNQPLEVHLCDTNVKTVKTIDIKGKSDTTAK